MIILLVILVYPELCRGLCRNSGDYTFINPSIVRYFVEDYVVVQVIILLLILENSQVLGKELTMYLMIKDKNHKQH